MLAVTVLAAIALAPFLLENQNLFGSALSNDFACYFAVGHKRRTDVDLTIAADEQDIRQCNGCAHLAGKFFDFDELSLRDAVLLSACSNYCIFHGF